MEGCRRVAEELLSWTVHAVQDMGLSEISGTLFWGPYKKKGPTTI